MGGFADQRDAVLREAARQGRGERKDLAARLDRDAAEHRLHPVLDLAATASASSSAPSARRLRTHDPDQAGALAGQGHLREGPGLGVELGRDIAWSRLCAKQSTSADCGDRRVDDRMPAARAPARCARPQRRPSRAATEPPSVDRRGDIVHRASQPAHHRASPIDRGSAHRRCQRGIEARVGNVQAEMNLADLAGAECHRPAADEARRGVDDAHHPQRRGLSRRRRACRCVEKRRRGMHQCCGAAVVARPGPTSDDSDAPARQRERRDQSGRPACRRRYELLALMDSDSVAVVDRSTVQIASATDRATRRSGRSRWNDSRIRVRASRPSRRPCDPQRGGTSRGAGRCSRRPAVARPPWWSSPRWRRAAPRSRTKRWRRPRQSGSGTSDPPLLAFPNGSSSLLALVPLAG